MFLFTFLIQGSISSYYVDRYNFSPDCAVIASTGDNQGKRPEAESSCVSASTSSEIQEFSGIWGIFKDKKSTFREEKKSGISSIIYNWYRRLEHFVKFQDILWNSRKFQSLFQDI